VQTKIITPLPGIDIPPKPQPPPKGKSKIKVIAIVVIVGIVVIFGVRLMSLLINLFDNSYTSPYYPSYDSLNVSKGSLSDNNSAYDDPSSKLNASENSANQDGSYNSSNLNYAQTGCLFGECTNGFGIYKFETGDQCTGSFYNGR